MGSRRAPGWRSWPVALTACGCLSGCDPRSSEGAADRSSSSSVAPWFKDITDEIGLRAVHVSGARGAMHMPEIMGSGVGLFDANDDGRLDIYLVNGNRHLPRAIGASNARNQLFLQRSDGTLADVTEASGLGDPGYGMGVAVGDVDNDGDLDVYVTNWGPDRLYRNQGDGVFRDVTDEAGVAVDGWSCSAAFLDYDRDGWLDLYVTRYVAWTESERCFDVAGRPDYCAPLIPADHDVLLRNTGSGHFEDVSGSAGIAAQERAALGVVCGDFDTDGWVDIYVANDAQPNTLWINNGDGTFTDDAAIQGVAYNLHGQPEAGMGVVLADLDGDLALDLFVTHTAVESNTLYRNLGGSRGYRDVSGESGLGVSSMQFTGFGTAALDVELDGDLDVVVVNGRVQRADPNPAAAVSAPWDRYAEPNLLYVNDGSGGFTANADRGGPFVSRIEVSRGLACGDLDGDGDLDLVVTSIDAPARVYRNDAPRVGRWLAVRAVEPDRRRDAIGATVTLQSRARSWIAPISGSTSYLTAGPAVAHFGLGATEAIDAAVVTWPDGVRERFEVGGLDRTIELQRGEGKVVR